MVAKNDSPITAMPVHQARADITVVTVNHLYSLEIYFHYHSQTQCHTGCKSCIQQYQNYHCQQRWKCEFQSVWVYLGHVKSWNKDTGNNKWFTVSEMFTKDLTCTVILIVGTVCVAGWHPTIQTHDGDGRPVPAALVCPLLRPRSLDEGKTSNFRQMLHVSVSQTLAKIYQCFNISWNQGLLWQMVLIPIAY